MSRRRMYLARRQGASLIIVLVLLVVIGLTIYFKSKNKSLSHNEGHASGHH